MVYGLGTVVIALLLGAMLTSALRWARLARAADRSAHGRTRLREGPSVLVGRVGAGTEPAVRLEIHQQGHEEKGSSGNWIHRWVEKERRIRVRPFELALQVTTTRVEGGTVDAGRRAPYEEACVSASHRC